MLPREAQRVIERLLHSARLDPRQEQQVRLDLEAHFGDGLDAGIPIDELVRRFGDAALIGLLIRRSRSQWQSRVSRTLRFAAAASVLMYLAAALRLQVNGAAPDTLQLELESASVMARASEARVLISTASGLIEGFVLASELRGRRNLWSETTSLLLLDEIALASDRLLSPSEQSVFRDSLRALSARESLAVRNDVLQSSMDSLAQVLGAPGRVNRRGLRLLQLAKGVEAPTITARLLEPLYFSHSVSIARMRHVVEHLVAARASRARAASNRLLARL